MQIIVESAVLVAIISGVFSLVALRTQSKLQYITLERKEWRGEIRNIAQKMATIKYKNFAETIVALKVRLNAYGYRNPAAGINEDLHIWQVIEEIEEKSKIKEIYEVRRKLLINYLELLLKRDWERTKWEVEGKGHSIASYITLCISYVVFAVTMFNYVFVVDYVVSLMYVGVIVLLVFLDLVLFVVVIDNISVIPNSMLTSCSKTKENIDKSDARRIKLVSFVLIIIYCLYGASFFITSISVFGKQLFDNEGIVIMCLIFCLFNSAAGIIKYEEQCVIVNSDYEYFRAVLRAKYNAVENIAQILSKMQNTSEKIEYRAYFHDNLNQVEKNIISAVINEIK